MKIVLIILGVLVAVFGIAQLFFLKTQKDIESYPYSVLERYDNIEVRAYEASLFTAVNLNAAGYDSTSSSGFSILAGYIFGNNERNEKIAMTSPVSMSLEDSVTMMFMVPSALDEGSLPKPNQTQIAFVEEPARTMAAIRFGGWANDGKLEKYKGRLVEALAKVGLTYKEPFYYFGYNAPYEVFKRRNEVVVELVDAELP
jgi:hypothetical protein